MLFTKKERGRKEKSCPLIRKEESRPIKGRLIKPPYQKATHISPPLGLQLAVKLVS